MVVSKRDLVKKISELTGQYQSVVRTIVQCSLDQIIEELSKGNRIEFRDFGVFEVVEKKARVARNPRTGEVVNLPKRTVVHFKTGRLMKEKVKKLVDKERSDGDGAAQGQEA